MKGPKKPAHSTEGLSDAIKSLQHLLDDVGTSKAASGAPLQDPFEETGEFELTGAIKALGGDDDAQAIDSHFDMSIPPALPGDDLEATDNIPTLSESIVSGEIPVLMEAIRLPEGKTIDVPSGRHEQPAADATPPAILDATEAAGDAVQIILRRYNHEPLSPQCRQQLESLVREYLESEFKNDSE
jgi:hypothetical protein